MASPYHFVTHSSNHVCNLQSLGISKIDLWEGVGSGIEKGYNILILIIYNLPWKNTGVLEVLLVVSRL